jgi:hypothetical protein
MNYAACVKSASIKSLNCVFASGGETSHQLISPETASSLVTEAD